MRIREQQQNQLMRQQPMIPGQMPINMRRNPMHQVPGNLQKTVLQNTSGLYVRIDTAQGEGGEILMT